MKIIRIDIRDYGRFNDISFEAGHGLNLICAADEEKREELIGFIRFVLYGLPARHGDADAERDRASAFGQSGIAAGSLDVETADGIFRIERRVYSSHPGDLTCTVTDLATGFEVRRGENAGNALLGVGKDIFDAACTAHGTELPEADRRLLLEAVRAELLSEEETQNASRALNRIRSTRRQLLSERGTEGKIAELRRTREALSARLDAAREGAQNTISLTATVEKYTRVTAETAERLREAEKTLDEHEDLRALHRFDELQQAEEELHALRAEEAALQAAHGCGGFYPDSEFAEALRTAAEEMTDDIGTIERAEADYKALMRAEGTAEQEKDAYAAYADAVVSAGGPQAVAARFASAAGRRRALKTAGVLLYCVGMIVIAAALTGYFLLSSVIPHLTLPAAAGIAAAGAIGTGIGAVLVGAAVSVGRGLDTMIRSLGLDPTQYRAGEIDASAGQLRDYAEFCLDVQKEYDAKRTERRALSIMIAEKSSHLAAANADARALLARCGITPAVQTDRELAGIAREAARRSAAAAAEMETLRAGIAAKKQEAAELRESLSGKDEGRIRAEMTAEKIAQIEARDYNAVKFRRDGIAAQLEAGRIRLRDAEKNLTAIEARAENPARLANELSEVNRSLREAEALNDALALAQRTLEEAPEGLLGRIVPHLTRVTSELLSFISGGRFRELTLSDDLSLSLPDDSPVLQSRSAREAGTAAAELSLRVAMIGSLFSGEMPPLLLRSGFDTLDASAAAALMSYLDRLISESGEQAMIFTCGGEDRLREQLSVSGAHFHTVNIP